MPAEAPALRDSELAFPWYDAWAKHAADDRAVITPRASVSYRMLAERIAEEEARLTREGFARGQRLLHAAPPGSVEWIATLIAGLNLNLQIVLPDQDWPPNDIASHTAPLLEEPGAGASAQPEGGVWLFTSGTTTKPKPRFRSRALLRSDVARVRSRLPDDLCARRPAGLCLLPLSHGFGLINGLLLVHAIGGTVLIDQIDRRDRLARLLAEQRVEILYSWPAHLEALSEAELWRQARTPLRWCVSSSLRLAGAVATRFAEVTGCAVRQQYGATETGPLCMDSGDPPSEDTRCMGTPVEGVSFRVLSRSGQPLPRCEEGQLAVKLDHLSLGSHELTAEGYWRTGDRGYQDAQGRVYVCGRLTPFTDERRYATQGG